jgi:hypothetical protein
MVGEERGSEADARFFVVLLAAFFARECRDALWWL